MPCTHARSLSPQCWKWSVPSNPGYYRPDVCTAALTKLKGYLSTIGFGGKGALQMKGGTDGGATAVLRA